MTIDIGNGKKDILRIRENDVPFDLAYQFCMKHNLNMKIADILAENIKSNMEIARNKNQTSQRQQQEEQEYEEREYDYGQGETQREKIPVSDVLNPLTDNKENAATKTNFYAFANQQENREQGGNEFVYNGEYLYRSESTAGNPAQTLKVEQSKRDTHKDTSRSRKSMNYYDEPGQSAHRVSMRNRNGLIYVKLIKEKNG